MAPLNTTSSTPRVTRTSRPTPTGSAAVTTYRALSEATSNERAATPPTTTASIGAAEKPCPTTRIREPPIGSTMAGATEVSVSATVVSSTAPSASGVASLDVVSATSATSVASVVAAGASPHATDASTTRSPHSIAEDEALCMELESAASSARELVTARSLSRRGG